ncbi:histidine kinase [Streptomyces sp. KM273126]|uniref:sensor histidine kinase n=1 Tax=Streptomyces sp. KM273126 TaxID=2545247 RepID=UPI00103E84D1|nr:histidine kinase [Streptomyces sp. KM273126]MBA2813669.1 histidine kinase [Streptomyces sp. KM273126]
MSLFGRYVPAFAAHRARIADAVLAVGCASATVTPATQSPVFHYVDWRPPLWFSVALALLVCASLWRRRRRPAQAVLVALAGWVAVAGIAAVVLAQYTLAERSRSWRVTAAATLPTVVVVGIPFWRVGGADAATPLSAAICVAPALLGLYVGTRRELVGRMRERVERAERERDLRVMQARSEERTQIARDMHDVVTHRVSLMVLHATALEAAEGRDATTFARQIGAIGREALDELRSLVGVLRNDGDVPLAPQPGLGDIDDLVTRFRGLGLPVTLNMTNDTGERPPLLAEHAMYRVAAEALTNVRKHAGDAATHVDVRQEPDRLRLSVVNHPGRNPGGPQLPSGGHGLLGIAERVRLVGGELTARPTADGGFDVTAVVPLAVEHDEQRAPSEPLDQRDQREDGR